MAKRQEEYVPVLEQGPKMPRKGKFESPEADLAEFGVNVHREEYVDGIVETAKVRELLDTFGLHERTSLAFPFQHIKQRKGEVWMMRIEPAAHHQVGAELRYGHHWVFQQYLPERTGSAQ